MDFNKLSNTSNCLVCGNTADYVVWGPIPMSTFCLKDLKKSYPNGIAYILLKDSSSTWLVDGKLKEKP
jgi:hypothetical protein